MNEASVGQLVDTYTAQVYVLPQDLVTITTSSCSCRPYKQSCGSQCTQNDSLKPDWITLRPVTPGDKFKIKFKVFMEGPAVLQVVEGVCRVNGEVCNSNQRMLTSGSFIELGSSYRLQYQATPTIKSQRQRVLPPTPGTSADITPPNKPTRQCFDENTSIRLNKSITEVDGGACAAVCVNGTDSAAAGDALESRRSFSGSVSLDGVIMDFDLRLQLKRIAMEINARLTGYKERKPPPPYEQVANSINYQLLHQNEPAVSTKLIDSLYPVLKEMVGKDRDFENMYSTFLSSYSTARSKCATPSCMLPADLPVVQFIMDSILQLCCMPDAIPLASKHCALWMKLVAVFSQSTQNQMLLIEKKLATPILSCMHLSVLSSNMDFQQHGWTVLGNILSSKQAADGEHVLVDASLALALSLVDQQLSIYPTHFPLVSALVRTISLVACIAKSSAGAELNMNAREEAAGTVDCPNLSYGQKEGLCILQLLKEHKVLYHLMRVPRHLRAQPQFQEHYCALVRALVPITVKRRNVVTRRKEVKFPPPPAKQTPPPPAKQTPPIPAKQIPPPPAKQTPPPPAKQTPPIPAKQTPPIPAKQIPPPPAKQTLPVRAKQTPPIPAKQTPPPPAKQTPPPPAKQTPPIPAKQIPPPPAKQTLPVRAKQTPPPPAKQTLPVRAKQTPPIPAKQTPPPTAKPPRKPDRVPNLRRSTIAEIDNLRTVDVSNVTSGDKSCQSTAWLQLFPHTKSLPSFPEHVQVPTFTANRSNIIWHPLCDEWEWLLSSSPCVANGDHQEEMEKEVIQVDPQTAGPQLLEGKDHSCPNKDSGGRCVIVDIPLEGSGVDVPSERAGVSRVDVPSERAGVSRVDVPSERAGVSSVDVPSERAGVSRVDVPSERGGFSSVDILSQVGGVSSVDMPSDSGRDSSVDVPNEGGGVSSVADMPSEGGGVSSVADMPSEGGGVSSVADMPSKGGGDSSVDVLIEGGRVYSVVGMSKDIEVLEDSESEEESSKVIASLPLSGDMYLTDTVLTTPTHCGLDTLSRDVQSLLDTLRAPLSSAVPEGGVSHPSPIYIPHVSRGSHYYRHSVKRRRAESQKEVGGEKESEPLIETAKHPELEVNIVKEVTLSPVAEVSSPRMLWGAASKPSSLLPDNCSLFEVSGDFLSSAHTALEEIASGHADVMETVRERAMLLEGILDLWSNDKGLQAATNTLQGCFSEGCSDIPLFIDVLQCFLQRKSPWTLAVCIVLLPALQQVIRTQRDGSCVLTVCDVLLTIVDRFSDLILTCKTSTRSKAKRISTLVDHQQQVVCYSELHSSRVAISDRLAMKSDPKNVSLKLRRLHTALKPYKHELCES